MKALRRRIHDARKAAGVDQPVIERDYAQSYVLFGLGETESLRNTLVFKGGTALKKIHFGEYRCSEDLDFTMVDGPKGTDLEREIGSAVDNAQRAARQIAPLTFTFGRYEEREPHPGGQEAFIVRIQFPWQRRPMIPVKLEFTHDEPVLLPAPRSVVQHGYDEPLSASVRTYCLEEIGAEKLRATRQTLAALMARGWSRPRARDYYDLWRLAREPTERVDWQRLSSVLPEKCRIRNTSIKSVDDVFDERVIEQVRATWERTLGPARCCSNKHRGRSLPQRSKSTMKHPRPTSPIT